MKPHLLHPRALIFEGDSRNLGNVLQPGTIDAFVGDPPSGIKFMGKIWDTDHGGKDRWVELMAEILRPTFEALKPGAHGLVWALPRTSHWTAYALEAAGFVIRDRVSHFFGNGFPKTLDVGKAIDDHLDIERAPGTPTGQHCGVFAHAGDGREQDVEAYQATITEPASAEAALWDGWQTALKPACEDWWLVRKPLAGTVAANVLAHGTGAINVDACRFGEPERQTCKYHPAPCQGHPRASEALGLTYHADPRGTELGRYPSHVILSHDEWCRVGWCAPGCPIAEIEAQTGLTKTGKPKKKGGAGRFFYCAKAPRSEKDAGLEHLPARSGGEATGRTDGSKGLQNPRAGAGRGGGARNGHPTVKSVGLMRYLCRLVTPPAGTVIDPFFGSGTTGVAALEEGFSIVGVEGDEEYMPINTGRIAHALKGLKP
jgi:hypothetical protein